MKHIRIGTVGLGSRGRAMTRRFKFFKEVELVAVCDLKPSNWFEPQWAAAESNIPAMSELFPDAKFYTDYDQMLKEANLDAIMVETGADIHAEFCAKALERDIHVLSDIPVCASLEEAELLWKAEQNSKARLTTGANPNEAKFVVVLNDFYKKGLLGKPYCMEAEYIHWELPGSAEDIHYNENGDWRHLLRGIRYCTHSLGPILTILNEELRLCTCFGTGQHADPSEYNPLDNTDDMMCAQFMTDSGVVVRLMRNKRCRAEIGLHNYRVFGTEGYIERIDRMDKPVIRYNSFKELETNLKEISGEWMPPEYADNPDALVSGHGGIDYALLDHFFKTLLTDSEPHISLKDGLLMTLPGIYAEESAKRGGEVIRMRYPWDKDWTTKI